MRTIAVQSRTRSEQEVEPQNKAPSDQAWDLLVFAMPDAKTAPRVAHLPARVKLR
jgi:hypothetical protein